ncbi:hypothetical protein CR513_04839, partial [Mucuna pruriens]
MKDKLKSMQDNDVWDLIELLEGVKPIGCQWIFKTKKNSKGNIERYKTRLVAKGFTQKGDIDYKKNFSPVSSKDSFRTVMALMNVKTVFLNGDINGMIYMVQPKNFASNESKSMLMIVYITSSVGVNTYSWYYVDDILLASSDTSLLHETKIFLKKNFEMKDLGEASLYWALRY